MITISFNKLGLFAKSHMDYELDRDKSPAGQPSLAEMTRKAIESLQNQRSDEAGFFLMVEGNDCLLTSYCTIRACLNISRNARY